MARRPDDREHNAPELSVTGRSRVLLTGVAGFIGCGAAKRLVEAGADVTVVDSIYGATA